MFSRTRISAGTTQSRVEEIMPQKIKKALISLSDKSQLDILVNYLAKQNIHILSTGGTAKAIREAGIDVQDVSEYTGSPEILDGRVKTLHPKLHGGILGCLDKPEHQAQMQEHEIDSIDLVVVNLYPFTQTVKSGADKDTVIENIDIGGPSMVRSAAKNHGFTTIITDPEDYQALIDNMEENNGATSDDFRFAMAAKAFSHTASYDSAISNWFAKEQGEEFAPVLHISAERKQQLRYGENPHQNAAFYTTDNALGISGITQLQGKELSYNNIHDASAAIELVAEFDAPAVAVIKHANPCGVAAAETIEEAYEKAFACDPVSSFGGIFAFNRHLTKSVAENLAGIFVEAIIAPSIDEEAKAALAAKKNLRVLLQPNIATPYQGQMVKSVGSGFLVQEYDVGSVSKDELKIVTKKAPSEAELEELLFAFRVCKHVKSNAIVLVKNNATIGIGAGQMSRVDASRIAAMKAADGEGNATRSQGAALASDAFFPFADGVEYAAEAGVKAIIQPGGSIRDEEVIAAADKHDIAMVFTGKRHFKH